MAHAGRDKRPFVTCTECNDTGCNECKCADCGEYLRQGEVTTCNKCQEKGEREYND